jgi:hypothetical protein
VVYGNGNMHLYEYFVHDVVWSSGQGYYWVNNENDLEGGSNDYNYAELYAEEYNSQAMIIGSIGWEATGHIYLYGYSEEGYSSELYVYVCYTYDQNWEQVGDIFTITESSPHWIDVGTPTGKFRYIAVVVYCNDWGDASYLFLDSVLIIPQPQQSEYYYMYDAYDSYVDGGSLSHPEYLNGSYTDGNRADIHCSNPPDMVPIYGEMNKDSHGQIEIYGYSGVGYWSNLQVYVSEDSQNWDEIGDGFLITANSPYWIDIGTPTGNFKYIIVVGYDNSCSVDLHLDCIRVTP